MIARQRNHESDNMQYLASAVRGAPHNMLWTVVSIIGEYNATEARVIFPQLPCPPPDNTPAYVTPRG